MRRFATLNCSDFANLQPDKNAQHITSSNGGFSLKRINIFYLLINTFPYSSTIYKNVCVQKYRTEYEPYTGLLFY